MSISIGILPGLLWTIFVGATFGTINARGVDGNEEFDQNSVRKGVVLGLGIGLGVMGLVGTGIYARQELTKIILAEQASEQAEVSIAEENARPQSSHDEFLNESNISSASLHDLENPQLGESYDRNVEVPTHESFLDNSERSLHNESFGEQRRDATPHRDTPWSPEAIALELPIVPHIFRRRGGSADFLESPSNREGHVRELHEQNNITTSSEPETDNSQQSKPCELHIGQRILDEIPFKWEKGENNRYHLTNRPRCNTDPISNHVSISQMDLSLREGGDVSNQLNKDQSSIRRLHSMADFDALRESTIADPDNESQAKRRGSEPDEGLDREWFWIWD